MQDKYENIVRLTEEQYLNDCNVTGFSNSSKKVGECIASLLRITVIITDHAGLEGRMSFKPGKTYFFTSKPSAVASSYEYTTRFLKRYLNHIVLVGNGFRYPPESPGPAINQISNPDHSTSPSC